MRVLLIDDEKELVATLSERFELRGIESDWATSAEKGLALLKEKQYDWVLVDLKMPGFGGFEAIKAVKRESPESRILLLTGHSAPQDLNHALDLGADLFMVKPVEIEDLLDIMQKGKRS